MQLSLHTKHQLGRITTLVLCRQSPLNLHHYRLTRGSKYLFLQDGLELIGTPSDDILHQSDCCLLRQYGPNMQIMQPSRNQRWLNTRMIGMHQPYNPSSKEQSNSHMQTKANNSTKLKSMSKISTIANKFQPSKLHMVTHWALPILNECYNGSVHGWSQRRANCIYTDKNNLDKSYKLAKNFLDFPLWEKRIAYFK